MFISQPVHSFGQFISEELLSEESGQRRWTVLEFAVAWSNHAGVGRIYDAIREFLCGGGRVCITVGLDFGRTTYEGLGRLLELETGGVAMRTHVFFDENPACTFHPKVFLFSNVKKARLVVGSNNMTGAGFHSNVEAALSFVGPLRSETIQSAQAALAAWRDEATDARARLLTRGLLKDLRSRGYVLTEDEIRARRGIDAGLRSAVEPRLYAVSCGTRQPYLTAAAAVNG